MQAFISQHGRNALADAPSVDMPENPTIAEVIDYWLAARQPEVKRTTWESYRRAALYVVGPLLTGTRLERYLFARNGEMPKGAQLVEMLGPVSVAELTTAKIRQWHRSLSMLVSPYTARIAKKQLRSALALAAEDLNLRVPMMPANRGRGRTPVKKHILTPAQIGHLLRAALQDDIKGIYYAFPFLTGVRPSEQLALLWDDIDFSSELIQIRRMQEPDGSLTELTKTTASTRDLPMSPLLKTLLLRWQRNCPIQDGLPKRVFPGLGNVGCANHKKRCCALSYTNFRNNYWQPAFASFGLPYVTPHSARHSFISTLQASGIEVGLVARLAGHANPAVTLSHYTQAVRGGRAAIEALDNAYANWTTPPA